MIKYSKMMIAVLLLLQIACKSTKNTTANDERGDHPRERGEGQKDISQMFAQMDINKDGKLSKTEVKGPIANDFAKIDSDSDGHITLSEMEKAPKPQKGQRGPRKN